MPRYAQIDVTTGICVGVSFLSAEVDAEHMILLSGADEVSPLDTYNAITNTWTSSPPITIEPPVDEIAFLKQDNENLNLQIIDLWETLIGAGVI